MDTTGFFFFKCSCLLDALNLSLQTMDLVFSSAVVIFVSFFFLSFFSFLFFFFFQKPHEGDLSAIRFSSSGIFATGGSDAKVKLWRGCHGGE